MSKLTKLIKHPVLFFKDALNKPSQKSKATPVSIKSTTSTGNIKRRLVCIPSSIRHMIHTGENMTHGPNHLSLWIPTFLRAGVNFMVLTRYTEIYQWVLKEYPFVNVSYAKGPSDVETLLFEMPFLRGIYYLSNTGNLIHSLRYSNYHHIFLGHGDSDKSASAHKFFRVYDQIWVAGQAHIDRFKYARFDTRHLEFVKIGRPQLADALKQVSRLWSTRLSEPRLLYLPTWEGVYEETNYSSLPIAAAMLGEVYRRFGLAISAKFHPATGSKNKLAIGIPQQVKHAMASLSSDFKLKSTLTPINQLIPQFNLFICDISAVVSECVVANAPLFVYIPRDKTIEVAQSEITYADYAYVFSDIEELCSKMQEVLNGNDYLAQKRADAMNYLISVEETKKHEFTRQLKLLEEKEPLRINDREVVIQ